MQRYIYKVNIAHQNYEDTMRKSLCTKWDQQVHYLRPYHIRIVKVELFPLFLLFPLFNLSMCK